MKFDLKGKNMVSQSAAQLGRRALGKVRRTVGSALGIGPVSDRAAVRMSDFGAADLDGFVAKTEVLGGPNSKGSAEYWSTFRYKPNTEVDQSLDPLGDEYFRQQISLYEEISGRSLDQTSNEQCDVNVALHVAAPNPYNHPDPAVLAGQLATLASVCSVAGAARGSNVLDMGCGWGLSSETLAYCGFAVDAVDINQKFVDLVNGRAARLGLPIQAVRSNFDEFAPPPEKLYAFALFYECFHHALKPWSLMEAVVSMLEPGGKLILASEPVQATWWRTWGLRLDPLSVYCIRKYGWFESGWSVEFLRQMFARNGLVFSTAAANGVANAIYIGTRSETASMVDLKTVAGSDEWWHEDNCVVSKGHSSMQIDIPEGITHVSITAANFRSEEMDATFTLASHAKQCVLRGGIQTITLPWDATAGRAQLSVISTAWCPNDVLKNGDMRVLSVHIVGIQFWKK